jgi:hypothetical protein
MLQKIRDFFKDRRPIIAGGRTSLEEQIETGTAIIEMLDKARLLDQVVVLWIEVDGHSEGIFCAGRGDAVTNWLYQTVSGIRLAKMTEMRERQAKESEKRIWEAEERRMDGGRWGDDDFGGPANGRGFDSPKK